LICHPLESSSTRTVVHADLAGGVAVLKWMSVGAVEKKEEEEGRDVLSFAAYRT
jgi:hypothetical protein